MEASPLPPIRVVHLINGYLPRLGGAERQLAAVAPPLQARGIELHVLTRRTDGLPAFEEMNGVPVHRLPVPGVKATASLVFTLSALLLIRRLRPQVIHAHEVFSATTTALAAKRLWAVPVVVTPHRSGPPGDVQRLRAKPGGARRLAAFRDGVDRWVTISREIDEELAGSGIPPARRVAIPNGVDITRFAPATPGEQAARRATLGLPVGQLVIFTGRLVPEKRVSLLLQVWPAVRAAHPDAHLLLLGSGPEEPALRAAAGEGVRFLGSVDDVAPYLQAADVFVLPSAAEGLSVALLEALATGLAALVTRVGGAADVIEHAENGWLVPPDDPAALQAALLLLLGDEGRRRAFGQQGRDRIVRHFSLPSVADRLRELYEGLLPPPHL